ncbi:peptidoglycan -binding protein [Notoacmeibacter sp. MSK16QG-6]|uniref:peptidoglycan -binding protein n=1 Tax=Notoacmeibacter sp. MSK16QG-6 TaxID=2957982 RepID=UPI00209FC902|nr:peptidoglycan -binding protein [Notoacmeibacter sp. MSK16QG-6]MCP1200135.1 peptidoglycan -binding protein [Notoacmeibacter sp. MSK16QG-6]
MALRRRARSSVDYWPGFVDAMATLLLVFTFLLSIYAVAQFILTQQIRGQDDVLVRLNSQISELTRLLALERASSSDSDQELAALRASLASAESDRSRLQALLNEGAGNDEKAAVRIDDLSSDLNEQQAISERALSQVEILNQQIFALRRQIAALEDALEASEAKERESSTRIADLGQRLNVALARRVQELNRYRSDFFGRLREILENREGISVVGDRFVFQSEVLFSSGSEDLNPAGQDEMNKLAQAVNELRQEIPDELDWILRVDGHTDNVPLSGTGRIRDNWELSAQRAIAVVKYLVDQGVPADRLAATGFADNQPLADGDDDESRRRNRRIELKLTTR